MDLVKERSTQLASQLSLDDWVIVLEGLLLEAEAYDGNTSKGHWTNPTKWQAICDLIDKTERQFMGQIYTCAICNEAWTANPGQWESDHQGNPVCIACAEHAAGF